MHAREFKDRALLDKMPGAFALHEMIYDEMGRPIDYRFLYLNAAFERLTGLRAEAVLGKTARQVLPGLEPHWIESYGRVASTGEPAHFKSHSEALGRDFEIIAYQTEKGLFACLVVEVTESTKLGNALLENEHRFQNILDNIPDLVWSKDRESRFISVNEAFGLACGRKPAELVGRSDLEIWPKALAEHYRTDDFKVMAEGKRRQVVETLIDKDGLTRWVETIKTPVRDKLGEVVGTTGIARDITERKQLEDLLRMREEKIESIFLGAPVGIAVLVDRSLSVVNDRFCETVGYCREELIGMPTRRLYLSDEDYKQTGNRFYVEPGQKPAHAAETRLRRKDGSIIDVLLTMTAMQRNDPRAEATFMVMDITDRKRAERELVRYAAELAEANKLKDLFTDILRHDIMNPVTAIRVGLQLMAELESDPKKAALLNSMRRSVSNLIEMTENAAKFARIAITKDMEVVNTDLGAMIRGLFPDFDSQLKEKDTVIELVAPAQSVAEVSPIVKEVFANLVSNAIKYGPAHGKIEIRVEELADSFVVSVKDRGEGISDANKERIFHRFERVGKQGVKGSGLGLAIAHRLVSMHRGRIWVEDNPQGGCIFLVELPKRALSASVDRADRVDRVIRVTRTPIET